MAARFKPKDYTLTSTSPVQVWVALGSPTNDEYASSLTIRASASNTADLYWEDADGAKGGYLEAGEAASMDLTQKFVSLKSIYLHGSTGDVVYITALG